MTQREGLIYINHLFQAEHVPTRLHVEGLRGHAGAHAIMVADGDSVELATFQVRYPAGGIGGAAAEKSLIFIHNGGGEGVYLRLATPRNQSLIGSTVQGGSNVTWWAGSCSKAKRYLTRRMEPNVTRL